MTMPPTEMPLLTRDDEIVEPTKPTFKIFSNALKAYEKEVGGVQRKMLRCTASSTVKDLHGDYMTDECVQGMAPQAKNKSMTIFLNHSYKWPEDVFGKTVDSAVVARAGSSGETVWDLDLDIELNEANPRAVETYTAIKEQGIKAGVSIGAMIEDYAFIDEEEGFWGGLEIKAVDLLEASIVGIPANQRSWVVNALNALGAPKAVINKALGRVKEAKVDEPKNAPADDTEKVAYPAIVMDGTSGTATYLLNGLDVTDEIKALLEKQDNPTTIAAAPDPEEEEETTDGESSDDDDDASETTAEAALAAAADAVDALKSAGADEALSEILLGLLEEAAEEVARLRATEADLIKERDEARQEVLKAAEIVETIASTPLGRKAQFVAPVETFRTRFAGIYDEGYLKLLDEGETTE